MKIGGRKRLFIQFVFFTFVGLIGGLMAGLALHQSLYFCIPIGGFVGYMLRATTLAAKYGYY